MPETNPAEELQPSETPEAGTPESSAAPADPRGESRTANSIVQVPVEMARENWKRKYAWWTWVPSLGHLYDGRWPGGEILLSPITAGEEKILGSQKQDRMELINTIIRRCIVSCPVPLEDMLLPDMFYLLLVLRNITYGHDYTFHIDCSRCGVTYSSQLTIPHGLQLRCLDETDEGEPWNLTLPRCGDKLEVRLLRVKDETDIRQWTKEAYRQSLDQGDPGYTYRLAKHIVTVNGREMNTVDKLDYCEEMIGGDSNALRNFVEKKDFGVRLMIAADCPSCGTQEKMRLPFDREFFRPGDSGG